MTVPDWPGTGSALRGLSVPGAAFALDPTVTDANGVSAYLGTATSMREHALKLGDHGDRRAVVCGQEVRTFTELRRDIASVASWLRDAGVNRGDRVAIFCRNRVEFPVVFWATQALGAVFVPFSSWWTLPELHYGIGDARPSVIFADLSLVDHLGERLGEIDVRVVSLGAADETSSFDEWHQVVGFNTSGMFPDAEVTPDDPATILYTSGTTGPPKGVVHTNRNHSVAVMNAAICAAAVDRARDGSMVNPVRQPVVLQVLPWFHIAGLSGMYAALIGGATLIVLPKWDAVQALQIVSEEGVTSLATVPTMLAEFVSTATDNGFDLSSLATLTSGASAVPTNLLHSASNVVGNDVRMATGYGLTETTSTVTLCVGPDLMAKAGSIGVPLPATRVRIVDNDGTEVAPGDVGEICVSGPTVAAGYWGNDEATRAAFSGGEFRTGDLGRLDPDGFIHLAGRIKDIIIRGGENIQVAEIENVIANLPGVVSVAVIGMPHPKLGEEVVAVLTIDAQSSLTDSDIIEHCRRNLSGIKVPARVIRTEDMPRNASGKILKRDLRRTLSSSTSGRETVEAQPR
ncbi:class I adenylate-forming enzyme family protein [Gordonia rubripertincta]|uniref:Class I adenylate-forming enzyme family protein n=1 Tax=Gordonia rubripertincta TaxID=36822 RepID=A0ABT4MVP8_GORRU|nr:class I adenylate-forming enzyme family protein [Gordonia rubripertincta]MCZ4551085.1 class I adenylate-forming enzyme family protein [Gordonia rubripertincta]